MSLKFRSSIQRLRRYHDSIDTHILCYIKLLNFFPSKSHVKRAINYFRTETTGVNFRNECCGVVRYEKAIELLRATRHAR